VSGVLAVPYLTYRHASGSYGAIVGYLPPRWCASEVLNISPIYRQTTNYGHFGKPELPWEAASEGIRLLAV
jgi:hypothetical protein